MVGGSVNGAASVAKPSGDREGGHKAADRNDGAGGNQASPVAPLVKQTASPSKAAVAKSQAQTEQPDPYKLRDLNAQEDMAYWAMWMFIAALFTFFVTSIGTFLIWNQVKLTRQAVEDTSEATEAMRASNEMQATQLRPYVFFEHPFLEQLHIPGIGLPANTVDYSVVLKNYGQTPALDVKLAVIADWGGRWDQRRHPMDPSLTETHFFGNMPPGDQEKRPKFVIGDVAINYEDVAADRMSLFIEGVITYTDAAQGEYETRFRYVAHGSEFTNRRFVKAPEGNSIK